MTATFKPDWRASPDGRRRAAILAGSVALHVAVLGLIGLGLFETRLAPLPADDTPIFVQMETRPLLEGETARVPSPSRTQAAETRALTGAQSDLLDPRKRAEDDDAPSPPAPRMAVGVSGSGAPAASASANPWTYTPESQSAAVSRSLRTGTGGCRIMDGHLSPSEQALCDDRFQAGAVEAARRHPLGARTQTASEQRRNEEFARQGAAALQHYEMMRRPMSGGVGIGLSSPDCPGGNLSGSCAGANLPSQYQHPEERPIDAARRRE
ncbi:MAG: hypothetical protein JWR59_951 [Brevundimonas sp.]|nr:hypothetical protein [Brevundimonas sp.]